MNVIIRPLLMLMVLVITASCSSDKQQSVEVDIPDVNMTMEELIGKTIEYRYGDDVYHVTIDSESELHWEAMAGGEKGVREEETYKSDFIDAKKLFVTWGEANGIGVSQILDFEKGVVHNHLLRGRDISIGRGEISILDK